MASAGSFNSNVPRLKSYSVNGEGSGEDDGECRQNIALPKMANGHRIQLINVQRNERT